MYTQEVTINNEVGLHARPATYFIRKANEFKSGIWVEKDERRVNAKSLLGVLSLGIVKGTTITLIADGSDEKHSLDASASLCVKRSSEPEHKSEQCRTEYIAPYLFYTECLFSIARAPLCHRAFSSTSEEYCENAEPESFVTDDLRGAGVGGIVRFELGDIG